MQTPPQIREEANYTVKQQHFDAGLDRDYISHTQSYHVIYKVFVQRQEFHIPMPKMRMEDFIS